MSVLLNFMDGQWSSCGDERIIVFTTNYKDKLDPALLRPGRMDMHIHMSYCTPQGFRILASNYLGMHDQHRLFAQIKRLIENVDVTPAEVAVELLRNEDADLALEGVINLLKRKIAEASDDPEENNIMQESNSGPEFLPVTAPGFHGVMQYRGRGGMAPYRRRYRGRRGRMPYLSPPPSQSSPYPLRLIET